MIGRIGEVSDDAADIGGPDSSPAYGVVAVDHSGAVTAPDAGGCDGEIMAADSATRIIFGQGVG